MAAKDTGPLDWRIAIVDKAGRPTPEFTRRWTTQRTNNALIGGVTLGSGVPTGSPADGDEYLDITTTPFTLYAGSDGSWHQVSVRSAEDLTNGTTGTGRVVEQTSPMLITPQADSLAIGRALVSGDQFTLYSNSTTVQYSVYGDNQFAAQNCTAYGTGFESFYNIQKARGTFASPTAVASGDEIGTIAFVPYDGSTFNNTVAKVTSHVDTFTGTNNVSGYMSFHTRPNGSGAGLAERLRIDKDGVISVGAGSVPIANQSGLIGGGSGQHEYEAFGALPLSSAFTFHNQGNWTVASDAISIVLTNINENGQPTMFSQAVPGSTPYNIYARIESIINGGRVGLAIRNNSTGNTTVISTGTNGNVTVVHDNITASSGSGIAAIYNQAFGGSAPKWFRINNNGTNLTYYVSFNGLSWLQILTETIASFVVTPTDCGVDAVATTNPSVAFLSSFGFTAPS